MKIHNQSEIENEKIGHSLEKYKIDKMDQSTNIKKTEYLKAKTYSVIQNLYIKQDLRWTFVWFAGLIFIWSWNTIFLNKPAFLQIQTACPYHCR